jgi:beta-lactamase regulating signal transducer with metallopeptidase domain
MPPDGAAAWVEVPLMRGIALAGVIRPRVLVGSTARQALTAAELEVAVAHELAHQRSRDNLTRALMRSVPDFLGFTRAGRRIERLWEGEAECLADARAVNGSPARATRLASAMVKVARLAGADEKLYALGWSTFHHRSLLERRVRLMVEHPPARLRPGCNLTTLAAIVTGAVGLAWVGGLPHELHAITEALIALLP